MERKTQFRHLTTFAGNGICSWMDVEQSGINKNNAKIIMHRILENAEEKSFEVGWLFLLLQSVTQYQSAGGITAPPHIDTPLLSDC